MLKKLKILLTVIYQGLWKWNKELSLLKKEFLECRQYLEVGQYELVFSSPSLVVLKHSRIEFLPESLQTTISEFWKTPHKNLDVAYKLTSKLFLIRSSSSRDHSNLVVHECSSNDIKKAKAQIALLRSSGKIVLFDLENNLVYTKYAFSKVKHTRCLIQSSQMWGYSMMKNEISNYFSLPADRGIVGLFYCHELVEGKSFSSLTISERLQIVREICYSAISASENGKLKSTVNGLDIIQEGFALALLNVKRPDMLQYIESRQKKIIEHSKSWRIVPSHCDLTAHNITILNEHPIILDLAPHKVGFVPSFFIPLCLIHSEVKEYGRLDLLTAFLKGELDEEFSSIIGKNFNPKNQHSHTDLLLAETIILAAIDSKITPQNIEYWFDPIFEIIKTNI
jgi:hypothetical protein